MSRLEEVIFEARLNAFLARIEAVCMVASMGADNIGFRTLNSAMGRIADRAIDACNKEAAVFISTVLIALLQDAPRPLIEKIWKAVDEHESFVEGLD